jgi:hypothetical protein
MKFIDEYNRLRATLADGIFLLILHYGHWYAFGECATDAIKSDPSIPLWRKSGAMEDLIHRDDEAWLCSFLAKMARSGKVVALAKEDGDGYKVTRVIRPGGAE